MTWEPRTHLCTVTALRMIPTYAPTATTDSPTCLPTAFSTTTTAPSSFRNQTPIKNLRVTAAHEVFHAVQFAYDILEDLWILENTAVWMEDEVYGGINDNLQYLANSSLKHPVVPLDFGDSLFQYGNYIFWKFATEKFGTRLVKQVWNKADGSPGLPTCTRCVLCEQLSRKVLPSAGRSSTLALRISHRSCITRRALSTKAASEARR